MFTINNLTLKRWHFFYIHQEIKRFFVQFDIIINVLVRFFLFVWILILLVHGYYKYFTISLQGSTLTSESDDHRRQILTSSVGPSAERVIVAMMLHFNKLEITYWNFHYNFVSFTYNNYVHHNKWLCSQGAELCLSFTKSALSAENLPNVLNEQLRDRLIT